VDAPPDPLLGSLVLRRWRLDAPLGEGALGVVYAAHDVETGAEAAVKVLRAELRDEGSVVARFLREAGVARRLAHPAIPRALGVGVAVDGAPALVMERVRGRDLRALLAGGAPPRATALGIAARVAEALAHAHARGVIHRDVKPSNIMLADGDDAPSAVRVLDFGLAFCLDEPRLSTATTLVGTPAYMPPEQARGEAVGPAADLYALGAVLVHLLSGATLYEGGWRAQLDAHARGELPDLARRIDGLDSGTGDLLRALLARDPLDRPPDAALVARALAALADGQAPAPAAPLVGEARAAVERSRAVAQAQRGALMREIVAVGRRRAGGLAEPGDEAREAALEAAIEQVDAVARLREAEALRGA